MQNKIQDHIDHIMKEARCSSEINISCLLCEPSPSEEDEVEISLLYVNGCEGGEYKESLGQIAVNIELESVKIQDSLSPPIRVQFLIGVCSEINGLIDHSVTEHPVDVGLFLETSGESCDFLDPYTLSAAQKDLYNFLLHDFAHTLVETFYRVFGRLLSKMDLRSVMVMQIRTGNKANGTVPNGKILIKTSVSNLAAAIRILDQRNLIGNTNKSDIFLLISQYFSTPGSESISVKSLRNHYYDPDPASLDFWDNEADKFKKAIKDLNWNPSVTGKRDGRKA